MGYRFGDLIELKMIVSELEATLIHIRGECTEVQGLEDLTAENESIEQSGYLGLCLKQRLIRNIPIQRPQCLVTYRSWMDTLVEYCNDDQPLSLLLVDDQRDPKEVLSHLLRYLAAFEQQIGLGNEHRQGGIHPSAVIDPSAQIAKDVFIGPFVVIEAKVRILSSVHVSAHCFVGEGVVVSHGAHLEPRVTLLAGTQVGDRTRIHAGAVIGSAGFGIDESGQLPHLGTVHLGSDSRIGALSCIDRATIGATEIGQGVQLDNLIQVGHNVKIGAKSVICAQSGIAGSAQLGERVLLGGQVGIHQGIEIHNDVKVAAKSGVTKSIKVLDEYSGYPAEPNYKRLKREARIRRAFDAPQDGQVGFIDSSAQVHPEASVHPTAVVGAKSVISAGCILKAYSVLGPNVTLGEGCIIASFAVIGSTPQVNVIVNDTEQYPLQIGEGNQFKEGVTISLPTQATARQHIGSHNLLMAYSHIGHDCVVGDHCVLANHVSLAGHVHLEDHVQVGGHAAVHQFVTIGRLAFIAANAMVSGDVPAYCLANGDRAILKGLNIIGLRRANMSANERLILKKAYRQLSKRKTSTLDSLIRSLKLNEIPETVRLLYQGFQGSRRPCCKSHRSDKDHR